MTEFKVSDLKKQTRLSLRQKGGYWMRRAQRTDKYLLQFISEYMDLSVTSPKVMRAFEQILPVESRLKHWAVIGKKLNLPLSDPMVVCCYWRARALATAAVIKRLKKNVRKGAIRSVQKAIGQLDGYQRS